MNNSGIWRSIKEWSKDRCVLIALEKYLEAEHISPSFRELGIAAGVGTGAGITYSLRRLDSAGFVKLPPPNKTRSLVVLRGSRYMVAPAFARKRSAKDLLANAADLLAEQPGAGEPEDMIYRWLADYAIWRKR